MVSEVVDKVADWPRFLRRLVERERSFCILRLDARWQAGGPLIYIFMIYINR